MSDIDRSKFIGSSEIATILGLNPYQTILELWAEKTGQIPQKDLSDNESVEWGKRLEKIISKKFADKNKVKLIAYKKRFYHPKYSFLSCELDNIIAGSEDIVEIKTCSLWGYKDWKDPDDIPAQYICQVMFALGLSNRKIGHIAVLIGGQRYLEKKVIFDQKTFDVMVEKAVDFWNNFVLTKTMPMQISYKDTDTLYQLFPEAKENEIALDDKANILCEQLEGLTADYLSLKDQIDKAKNELKVMLKDNAIGKTNNYKISWREQIKKSYTVAESKSRVFRFNKINKEE